MISVVFWKPTLVGTVQKPCPKKEPQESKPEANSSAKWDSAHGRNPYTSLSPLVGPPFPKV